MALALLLLAVVVSGAGAAAAAAAAPEGFSHFKVKKSLERATRAGARRTAAKFLGARASLRLTHFTYTTTTIYCNSPRRPDGRTKLSARRVQFGPERERERLENF